MKSTFSSIISLLILAWAAWFSLNSQQPSKNIIVENNPDFEVDNALAWVQKLSEHPRHVGSKFHDESIHQIQNFLSELEIDNHTQSGFVSNTSGSFTLAQNIVAQIQGSKKDASTLLVLAHYDSAMIHSHGASDNLSGVAVILESLRTLKKNNFQPENNLIFLFTDAEEIGLLGAKLFAEQHPLAKQVDFTINFEARGTSGPSNMIIETNQGNYEIIKEFIASKPSFPVANSLMYNVYKLLPNDTDSTVFREVLDVPGLFFAFIDDHQHYHTSLDNYSNLDQKSLMHHAIYLNETIAHFSTIDLDQFNSEQDLLYFNFPIIGMISFSLTTAIIILVLNFLLFVGFSYYAWRHNMINGKVLTISSIRLLAFLVASGLFMYGIWYFTKLLIPHYKDYIHGFSSNAHYYIAFCFAFVIGLGFLFYRTPSHKYSNLYASYPAYVLWFLIFSASLLFFQGLSYLILPFTLLNLAYFLLFFNQTKKSIIKLILALPMLMVMVPLLRNLIIGLGLDAMPIVAVLTALLFASLLPIVGLYPFKKSFGYFAFCVALFYWGNAYVKKRPTADNPLFSSLNFQVNLDTKKAQWRSYNNYITPWLQRIYGEDYTANLGQNKKGNTRVQLSKEVDFIAYEKSKIEQLEKNRFYLKPHHLTSSLRLSSLDFEDILEIRINNKKLAKDNFLNPFLFRYFVVHQEPIDIHVITKKNKLIDLSVEEVRYTLLEDERLHVSGRPRNEIPMPFVTTDAVLINYSIEKEQ